MNSVGEAIERAIVFEEAFGYRRLSAQRCIFQWLAQFRESLIQVDLGLRSDGPVLFVILRLREDLFTEADQAAIVGPGEHAGGRVLNLSELEYQERGNFLTRFNDCTQQRLGVAPDYVTRVLIEFFSKTGERRAAVRHPVSAPAVVTVDGQKEPAAISDLSEGGALVKTPSSPALKVQSKVELEVALPTGPVRAEATVVEVSERGVSLQFAPGTAVAEKIPEKLAGLEQAKLDSQLTVESLVAAPGMERVGMYELRSLLGTGGAAEVHYAFALDGPLKGQDVAFKRLHKRRSQDSEAIRQFEVEQKTLMGLKHPNIVKGLEYGSFEGQPYLVMELIEGRDLGQIIRKARTKKKQLPVEVACFAGKVLLDALVAVHSAKDASGDPLELVHCDISPHNLFVAKDGTVKLGDFGSTRKNGVVVGQIMRQGRPTYLSPELIEGHVSQAADLWAAGVTLYELLTLELPFQGNTIDELRIAVRGDKPAVPLLQRRKDASGPLEAVLKRALEKNPALRFQSAKEFAAAVAPHFHPVRAPKQLAQTVKELFG